jgi:hypothetical protein
VLGAGCGFCVNKYFNSRTPFNISTSTIGNDPLLTQDLFITD